MVEQVSLRVGIDARPAAAGADSFKRSAADIIRSADKMGRAVSKAGGSFDKLKKAANDNSRTLSKTAQSLRDVEIAVNSLSRSAGQVRSLNVALRELSVSADLARGRLSEAAVSSNNLAGNLGGNLGKSASSLTSTLVDLGLGAGLVATALGGFKGLKFGVTIARWISGFGKYAAAVRVAAKAMSLFRAVLVTNPLGLLIFGLSTVVGAFLGFRSSADSATSASDKYKKAIESTNEILLTAEERQRALNKAKKDGAVADAEAGIAAIDSRIASLLNQQRLFERFIEKTNPRTNRGRIESAKGEMAEINAELEDLNAERIDLENRRRRVKDAGKNPSPSNTGDASGDTRVEDLIGKTNRSIELLNQQNNLIAVGETAFAEQKAREAEIRERILGLGLKEGSQKAIELEKLLLEKDRLDQVNKSLKEQAELRERTEDDTDKLNARAAALEDLATKLESSGLSAAEMQVEIDLLNSAVAAGVDVTKEWGQEWLEAQRNLNKTERAVKDLKDARKELEDAQKKADEDVKRRAKVADDVINGFKDTAKDAFKDVIKGTESVSDAFKKLANSIQEKLLDLALDELLSGGTGFSDVFAKLSGGIFGGPAPANDNKKSGAIAAEQPPFKPPPGSISEEGAFGGGGGLAGILGSLLSSVFGGGGTTERPLDKCCENFEDFGREWLTDLNGVGEGVAGKLEEVFVEDGGGWTEKAGEVFTGPGEDFLGGLGNIFDDGISGLSDILTSLFSGGGSGGGGSGIGGIFGALTSGFGGGGGGSAFTFAGSASAGLSGTGLSLLTGHQGGLVDDLPRYHTGGISGLRPDEVPAILQRGEEVLTANDARHRDNGGAGGGNVVVNVSFPNARNTDEARQAGSEIAAKAAAAAQRGMARKGIG